VRYLTENPFDELEPVWRPDARGVVYLHDRDASRSVHRVFSASRAATPVADVPGMYGWPAVGPDSETVAMTFTSPRRPVDVWVREGDQVTLRPITDSLGATIDPRVLVEPVHVRYPSADGREVPALLYVPHAEAVRGTMPGAVLYVHGGPTGQHFRWWDPTPQLLANRGLVVLAPNVRGSTGYGREWQELNRRDWGGGDLADVIAGVEWLATEKIADPKSIGITGGSYGGYMTLYALARHPDRFAAGVSSVGVVSWKSLFDTTRGDLREYLIRELGDAAKDHSCTSIARRSRTRRTSGPLCSSCRARTTRACRRAKRCRSSPRSRRTARRMSTTNIRTRATDSRGSRTGSMRCGGRSTG
jgi:dipeptidyl aminopeptidase/acylaminoacyl peptidase